MSRTVPLHAASPAPLAVEKRRRAAGARASPDHKATLGQFFTPAPVAQLMAAMFGPFPRSVRLLDAGAGVGSLTAAFVDAALASPAPPARLVITAVEVDAAVRAELKETLAEAKRAGRAGGIHVEARVVGSDFLSTAAGWLRGDLFGADSSERFDAAILNPPYKKLGSNSAERRLLRQLGLEATNLYAAFVALAARLLAPDGELVAITPRSFCNGPYFRAYRHLLLDEVALHRIHLFEARDLAFADDKVLQENVIVHAVRSAARRSTVLVTRSLAAGDARTASRKVPLTELVDPNDPERFIHLPSDESDRETAAVARAWPCTLAQLGIEVSTGRVVDFRCREALRPQPVPHSAPLIYPIHCRGGLVRWPLAETRKPQALMVDEETRGALMPVGPYVVVRRFSSKEERRRVVPSLFDESSVTGNQVAFENHLNVFHRRGRPLPLELARGLAVFLGSTLVDQYFRQFNGHTQVNATDLRSLRYPAVAALCEMGSNSAVGLPDQATIDRLVSAHGTRDVVSAR